MRSEIHIGTSGWNYDHWKGPFYPEGITAGEWFDFYAERFHTVEINNTFYQLPKPETFEKWREKAPKKFFFAVKASRYITHMKKLKDPRDPVANFMEGIRGLGDKQGPVLFQLPPRWKCNPERLKSFLTVLPEGSRYAFEFRDDTWWTDEVYDILRSHNAAFCGFDLAGQLSPLALTADFAYIRLHGPGEAYQGQYDDETLSKWAEKIREWAVDGLSVYVYFDNDENGYAALNAMRLQEMVKK